MLSEKGKKTADIYNNEFEAVEEIGFFQRY